ncbi:MAG: S8 family serine peptidase [Candidatus Thermoplasmatota archaeon]|nr:S8 family serine peptidase [Candidatus Thermoplasmatota archaeon]
MGQMRGPLAILLSLLLTLPMIGTIAPPADDGFQVLDGAQLIHADWTTEIPAHQPLVWNTNPWWTWTNLDQDRNGIHDSLQTAVGTVWVGLSYDHTPTIEDENQLIELGFTPKMVIPAVDAILIGAVDALNVTQLSQIDGVVMVERYGSIVFYGDIQTLAVKARNSTEYPESAWQLGVSGHGVNIALTDTGVDSEHPGLEGKHVAGYDAVCFVHSDPMCVAAGGRQSDGSFDPDDGNQHGTACMGMAAATGIEADGSQSEFYGSAPNASLVDVRIGTDVGAGPFENYLIEQEFYESAMNGLQWIIDNKDTAWPGVDESLYGIDIISLSWGITSHEGGGSDGEDMHSRILNEATEAGVTVSNAAGNDGEDNDGLSGMSSSSLSITVGATDDKNTVDREDDTVAGYSSRGPRRDNGDGNPINELIPEISAPGTNIIQAEGCVTSGGCSNLFSDASENTYTGRGSGTSYATPAVTGVIALVMEANPDLNPMQIKEVLKQTSERRGPASAPDVDPYWNRDFGYGMVDARAAVEMAFYLGETDQSTTIDWTLQNHLLNVSNVDGKTIITGHAWTQSQVIDSVQYRIGDGDWNEVTYDSSIDELGPLTPFNWTVALLQSNIPMGEQTIEIRAVSGDQHSLPVLVEVTGSGTDNVEGLSMLVIIGGSLVLIAIISTIIGFILMRQGSSIGENEEEIIEAEILEDTQNSPGSANEDLSALTVPELKQRLSALNLPVSGKKSELIERLSTQTA